MTALRQDEFLVMASDGLFDVMGDQSVVDTVSKYLREHDNWCPHAPARVRARVCSCCALVCSGLLSCLVGPVSKSLREHNNWCARPRRASARALRTVFVCWCCSRSCARVCCPVWWARSASTRLGEHDGRCARAQL